MAIMGDDNEVKEHLRALRDHAEKQANVPAMLQRLHDEYLAHDKKDEVRHAELVGEHRRLSLRIGNVEGRVAELRNEVEETGKHDVAELRDEIKHRTRARSAWISGIAAALIVAAATGSVSYIVGKAAAAEVRK